jgi:hypothetical protein
MLVEKPTCGQGSCFANDGEGRFADIGIWQLPRRASGSAHRFKYRLAFVVNGVCLLRFDNESRKGDYKHVGSQKAAYAFTTLEQLVTDFWKEVSRWTAP